ncbi:MAG: hypothetical protein PF445_06590 [Melioribacteraceae bacterium]|nr:hypothetical protein [Melioribacteraceae bacterium]
MEYSIKSSNGNELYKIIDKVDYDIPYSKLEVFEEGRSVLISAFSGTLTFISRTGNKTKTKKIIENINVEYERNILSVVDKDNLLILFSGQNEKSSTIQKYGIDGILVNEFKVPFTDVNGIAYSESLAKIYLSHVVWQNSGKLNKQVVLLDESGETINNFNATFEKGFFTEENIFVAYANKSLLIFDTKNLKLLINERMTEKIILDVTYENKHLIYAVANKPELKEGKWFYKNPTLKKMDLTGNIIEVKNISSESFSKYEFVKKNEKVEFKIIE